MILTGMASRVALAAAYLWLAAGSAMAQVTIGSPGDPITIAVGAGAFDITPSNSNPGGTAAELRTEYRLGSPLLLWPFSPFVGVSGTSDGAFYGYGGFGIDINLTPEFVVTPNFAAGYFARGNGTNLGSWMEFRSGAEFAWRLPDQSSDRGGAAPHLERRAHQAQSGRPDDRADLQHPAAVARDRASCPGEQEFRASHIPFRTARDSARQVFTPASSAAGGRGRGGRLPRCGRR